jgi:exopolysaccharide biosynthesis polyprenyl glycosylphosphotransferase
MAAISATVETVDVRVASVPSLVSDRGPARARLAAQGWAARQSLLLVGVDLAVAGTSLVLLQVVAPSLRLVDWVLGVALWLLLVSREQGPSVARAGCRFGLVGWAGSTLGLTAAPSADLLVMTLVLTLTASLGRRGASRALGRWAPATRVLVVGRREAVDAAVAELARAAGVEVAGWCQPQTLRSPDALGRAVEETRADTVLVIPSEELGPRDLQRIGWQLEQADVALHVGSGLVDVTSSRATLARLAGLNTVHVRGSRRSGVPGAVKEAGERAAALVLLALLAPLFGSIALLVRRDSPGPAFFRQVRVGRDGVPFSMLKFRTMVVDAEHRLGALERNDADGVLFKLRLDPRVTPIGRFLRKYSLDELPQLVNVVRGEMSLVGPRPALPQEVEKYDADPRRRLAVKPGLTGLWQVSGRSDLSWDESVRLDLSYVDNWTLALDARIVARTFAAVAQGRGAY